MTNAAQAGSDRIGDRLEIQDLVLAYSEAIDAGDAEAVAMLFCADGCIRAYDRPQGEASGRREIENLVAKLIDSFAATVHHVSPPRITFLGEEWARGVTMVHAWHEFRADRPDGLLWGRYHDAFRATEDGWRFASRTLRVSGHRDFRLPWIPPQSSAETAAPHTP